MTVIDPKLLRIFDDTPAERRGETWVNVLFKWDRDLSELDRFGMRLGPTGGGIISAQMPLSKLHDVHRLGIESLRTPRPMRPRLDVSRKDISADTLASTIGDDPGRGVIVGIVDTGIDHTHPSFRNSDGSSRILYLWDHRVEMVPPRRGRPLYPGEQIPSGLDPHFEWGVEYTKKVIDDALLAKARRLRVKDGPGGHGSHVAGTAAGNGQEEMGNPLSAYIGVATHADIVAVALNFSDDPSLVKRNPNRKGIDPFRQAIEYIIKRAEQLGRPWVINLSLGQDLGARDGKSLEEEIIANWLADKGRAIVVAAGNEADSNWHAAGKVAAGRSDTLSFKISPKEPAGSITIEIWFGLTDTSERFDVQVTDPKGNATVFAGPAVDGTSMTAPARRGTNKITVSSTLPSPEENKNRIEIDIAKNGRKDRLMPGTWTIRLTGRTVSGGGSAGRYHAYLSAPEDDTISRPEFTSSQVSTASTVSIPSTAKRVICVGSYITKPSGDLHKLSDFSNHGPTLDGRRLPTLCAPGQMIKSARAWDGKTTKPRFVEKQGTSMAAPHVTGVVAAMLQVRADLKPEDIASILTTQSDAPPHGSSPDEWGSGRINAQKSVTAVKSIS